MGNIGEERRRIEVLPVEVPERAPLERPQPEEPATPPPEPAPTPTR